MALILPVAKPAFQAWPDVNPGKKPLGAWVLVQYKLAPTVTKGGIVLADASRDDDQFKINVARVLAVGPLAFRDEVKGELLAEAPWFSVGDFVVCPLTGGAPFEIDSSHGPVRFGFWKDLHFKAIDLAEAEEYERLWRVK